MSVGLTNNLKNVYCLESPYSMVHTKLTSRSRSTSLYVKVPTIVQKTRLESYIGQILIVD